MSCIYGSLQQLHHDIRSVLLRHFPAAVGKGAAVELFRDPKYILSFGTGQKAEIDWDKGIAVWPFERKQAETLPLFHGDMFEGFWYKPGSSVTGKWIECVIYNEYIFPVVWSQQAHELIYDAFWEQRREPEPVCLRTVQETVDCILGEVLFKRFRLYLHEHASVWEDDTEEILEDQNSRNAFFFSCSAKVEEPANLIFAEKTGDCGIKFLFIFCILC